MSFTRYKPHPIYLAIGLLCAALLYAYVMLFHNALIDDAFITLNYVKTLTTHGTWGFYPVHTTNSATSPLNVLVLSLVTLVTRSPLESVFYLTLVEWGALAYFLYRIGQLLSLRWFALVAFPALVFNPLLISTLGLESTLFLTLLTAALYFFLTKRFDAYAVAAALLTLTRPDGALFFVLALFWLPTWKTRLRVTLVYALCLAPWYLYSWTILGSLIPDTLLIKLRQSWGNISFGDGMLLYARRFPLQVTLSLLFAPFAALALVFIRKWNAFAWLVFLFGLLHFAAYTAMRVPPYHWYYVPEIGCIILLGAYAVSQTAQSTAVPVQRALGVLLLLVALLAPITGMVYLLARAGLPLQESFIQTNWSTHDQYRAVGEYLAAHHAGETVPTQGEPGTIGYYCNCYLLDNLFTTRTWVAEDVAQDRTSTQPLALLFRLNYLLFKPSEPYPSPKSNLVVLTHAATPDDPSEPHWFTANSWVKDGLIVLHEW